MKKAAIFLLLLLLLGQHFVGVSLHFYYLWNKQYYSEQLCENKTKPELNCHGQCYLGKQLKKAEEGERKSATMLKEATEWLYISTTNSVASTQFNATTKTVFAPYSSTFHLHENPHSLLKPPIA